MEKKNEKTLREMSSNISEQTPNSSNPLFDVLLDQMSSTERQALQLVNRLRLKVSALRRMRRHHYVELSDSSSGVHKGKAMVRMGAEDEEVDKQTSKEMMNDGRETTEGLEGNTVWHTESPEVKTDGNKKREGAKAKKESTGRQTEGSGEKAKGTKKKEDTKEKETRARDKVKYSRTNTECTHEKSESTKQKPTISESSMVSAKDQATTNANEAAARAAKKPEAAVECLLRAAERGAELTGSALKALRAAEKRLAEEELSKGPWASVMALGHEARVRAARVEEACHRVEAALSDVTRCFRTYGALERTLLNFEVVSSSTTAGCGGEERIRPVTSPRARVSGRRPSGLRKKRKKVRRPAWARSIKSAMAEHNAAGRASAVALGLAALDAAALEIADSVFISVPSRRLVATCDPIARSLFVSDVSGLENPSTETLVDNNSVGDLSTEIPIADGPGNVAPANGNLTAQTLDNETLAIEKPSDEYLATEDPVNKNLATEDPVNKNLATEDPVNENLATEDPVNENLAAADPVNENLATEDPVNENPAAEDPVNEYLATEDPFNENLAIEDPATEVLATVTSAIDAVATSHKGGSPSTTDSSGVGSGSCTDTTSASVATISAVDSAYADTSSGSSVRCVTCYAPLESCIPGAGEAPTAEALSAALMAANRH